MTDEERRHFAGVLVGIARSETTESIESVAQALLDYGWRERYSLKYLASDALPVLVDELRPDPSIGRATQLFDDLVRGYENFSTVQVIAYPIKNLSVPPEGLEVGVIDVCMVEDSWLQAAEAKVRAVLAGSLNDEATQERMVETFREQFGLQKGSAVAEIRVVAVRDIAKERARERYDELTDFLNGAATILHPLNHGIRVAAPGEIATEIETVLVLSEPVHSVSMPMTRVGPYYRLEMNSDALKKLQDCGYWAFSELLAKEPAQRTEFETALLLSLHWYASHSVQRLLANQLVSLCISAETLFPPRRRSIGFSTAEGVAFVLEAEPERRFAVRAAFRRLYAKRGNIAHRGSDQVTERDVAELANLVMGLLVTLVGRRDEFETTAALDLWVDALRLA